MKEYRFKLEKRSKKVLCYGCGKRRAVAFVDIKTGERLPEQYCKCDREANCTYFLSPYHDGYAKTLWEKENVLVERKVDCKTITQKSNLKPIIAPQAVSHIPFHVLRDTLNNYTKNEFIRGLSNKYGREAVDKQIALYYLGTSNRWEAATTFPFIDVNGNTRAIQVKRFDKSLHTDKYLNKEGELVPCIGYHEYTLKYNFEKVKQRLPEWLINYLNNEKKVSCNFGDHLLNLPENKKKTVAIVEAPKTAIIANIHFEKLLGADNYVWIAVGALGYLTKERCEVFSGRNVVLYPDLNAFDKWQKKANELSSIANFKVSELLEKKATEQDRIEGLDLADYLLKIPFDIPHIEVEKKHSISLSVEDIINAPIDVCFDGFTNIRLVTLETTKGYFDVLFDKDGNLYECDFQMKQKINELEQLLNREIKPMLIDGKPCLALF